MKLKYYEVEDLSGKKVKILAWPLDDSDMELRGHISWNNQEYSKEQLQEIDTLIKNIIYHLDKHD